MAKNLRERFSKAIDPYNAEFVASVREDDRLVPFDIQGSIAHAKMLAQQGLISHDERDAITHGLQKILAEWQAGKFTLDPAYEDVHMNVEHRLTQITPAGAKLHTARSRNDQVALDLRLWAAQECDAIIGAIRTLQDILGARAQQHEKVIMPGVTHLQHAQPIHVAHALLAWYDALARDASRFASCWERLNVSPLGACALAGTSLPIDPPFVARELSLAGAFSNSLDAVGDRDFCVELTVACALLMVHLSQMAEMLVLWSAPEFGYVELPDELCTSSSIMPQKKNPDMIELVRAKAGRVFGAVSELLATLKALPLGYNRDLQMTKGPMFAAADTSLGCLRAMSLAFEKLEVNVARLEQVSHNSQMLATDLAEYLVRKGVAFRSAHAAVGQIMRHCAERRQELARLSLKELRRFNPAFEKDALDLLDPRVSVARRNSPGGTGTDQVRKRLAGLRGAHGE
ncbi:MAG: argininosuccinate lyase [Planctomycetes bacterium]|nr:argininosuccinate lyase [Planctomycetota bacterium]